MARFLSKRKAGRLLSPSGDSLSLYVPASGSASEHTESWGYCDDLSQYYAMCRNCKCAKHR